MIRSMTGFGRAPVDVGGAGFEVEVRSVNHRFLDLRIRLPRALSAFESEVRARVQERFSRGKIDLAVSPRGGATPAPRFEIDFAVAEQYVEAAGKLAERHGLEARLGVAALLALPGVSRFVEPELPVEVLRDPLLAAVEQALEATDGMRQREGGALERELLARLTRVRELADALESRAGDVQQAVRERLRKRAAQLQSETGLVDEARLQQEVVLAADRLDIREEAVRLRSHVDQFREAVAASGPGRPAGRRLEFLLQELSREANTIGSKGSDAGLSHRVVELKTELERLREQVQNVE
ncbi:MAG: YicC family protein [Deltaproteobacteria bacterium]|nr:MAG: YicC family protein [Deltaproteobacteria bacterium]